MIDKHFIKRIKHIVFDGYDCCEIFNLNHSLSKYILPKLILFKKLNFAYPYGLKPETWDKYLDDMIYALEVDSNMEKYEFNKDVNWKRVDRGFSLLGKYWRALWI